MLTRSLQIGCALCLLTSLTLLHLGRQSGMAAAGPSEIVVPKDASKSEILAARELRRYIYLRTGRLCVIRPEPLPTSGAILVCRKGRAALDHPELQVSLRSSRIEDLNPEEFVLRTVTHPGGRSLAIVGGDDVGTLYGAYRFAEILGIRFYLHGDVVPDARATWILPEIDERSTPLFALRGIQPFHDFPEGPDWWNRDDYLAVLGQLPKLRMNFFGLHTYPEERPNAEPTVWIGPGGDFGAGGTVVRSYPASYQNTLRGNWGYQARKTSQFVCGTAALFERDDYGPEVMYGFMPAPVLPQDCNRLFDSTAGMLRDAFTFARQLGIKTCVGTETPLIVPKQVQQRLRQSGKDPASLPVVQELYEGIFRRAAQAYPLDYYWLWTPENWTWSGTKEEEIRATTNDLFAAIAAHRTSQAPFALATCGWVLGPQQDRAMFDKILPKDVAVSCINREVGKTPVEPGFAQVQGRSKWAIPWMEDDPALTSPQLWVGRMRRDAADALRYGCDGLMGIHWRTRALAPNVSALASAAWQQAPWLRHYPGRTPAAVVKVAGPIGGQLAAFPANNIKNADIPALYQTVRYNVAGYHIPASNGTCRVVLKFCEPHYDAPGKRVFDVQLQGRTVITNLDIFARVGKDRAVDFTFERTPVTNGWVEIGFVPVTEYPSIAALIVEGDAFSQRVNCGGPALEGFAADLAASPAPQQVFAPTWDFYMDWATHEFGPEVGPRAADVFRKTDCALPVPSTWTDGPGGIRPDPRPWAEARREYAFVDDFACLRPEVKGPGNLDRFDYWLSTFRYLRSMGEVNCAWGEYNRALEGVKREVSPEARSEKARSAALPARIALVAAFNTLMDHLLATVTSPGELGTVANWNQHNLPVLLDGPGEELEKLLGSPLPPAARPRPGYQGPTRVIVPTLRGSLSRGEPFSTRVIVLGEEPPSAATICWRKLGSGRYSEFPLQLVARNVYRAVIPDTSNDDFEYFIRVQPAGSRRPLFFPASAPVLAQTVIRYD